MFPMIVPLHFIKKIRQAEIEITADVFPPVGAVSRTATSRSNLPRPEYEAVPDWFIMFKRRKKSVSAAAPQHHCGKVAN